MLSAKFTPPLFLLSLYLPRQALRFRFIRSWSSRPRASSGNVTRHLLGIGWGLRGVLCAFLFWVCSRGLALHLGLLSGSGCGGSHCGFEDFHERGRRRPRGSYLFVHVLDRALGELVFSCRFLAGRGGRLAIGVFSVSRFPVRCWLLCSHVREAWPCCPSLLFQSRSGRGVVACCSSGCLLFKWIPGDCCCLDILYTCFSFVRRGLVDDVLGDVGV